jgi:hypothetical protein
MSDEDAQNAIEEATVAYQLIKWWLNSYIEDIFVTDNTDATTLEFFLGAQFNNNLVVLPMDASDNIFAEVLYKKISVLGGDSVEILGIELHSTDFESTIHFNDSAGYHIPLTNDEYEGRSLYEVPWWCREDCETMEAMKIEDMSEEDLLEAICSRKHIEFARQAIYETTFGNDEDLEEEPEDEPYEGKVIAMRSLWTPAKV